MVSPYPVKCSLADVWKNIASLLFFSFSLFLFLFFPSTSALKIFLNTRMSIHLTKAWKETVCHPLSCLYTFCYLIQVQKTNKPTHKVAVLCLLLCSVTSWIVWLFISKIYSKVAIKCSQDFAWSLMYLYRAFVLQMVVMGACQNTLPPISLMYDDVNQLLKLQETRHCSFSGAVSWLSRISRLPQVLPCSLRYRHLVRLSLSPV